MYKCPRCGEVINNVNEPCPTCGLYINPANNNINENKEKKSINIIFILLIGMLIGAFLFIINSRYNSKEFEYIGNGYKVNYSTNTWYKYDEVEEFSFALQYKGTQNYLFFADEIIDLQVNIDNDSVRNNLYQSYQKEFITSTTYNYSNVMSEIKKMSDTDYYYLTADFFKLGHSEYNGKLYLIFTSDGRCLTLVLVGNNSNSLEIDENIFELIKNIKIEN